MRIRPTNGYNIELRSSLLGLVLLLGKLVLEPFLLGSRRLTDLLELLFKVSDPLLLCRRVHQQVGPTLGPFCQGLLQHNKLVSDTSTNTSSEKYIVSKPTVSAWLMVTMLVHKACISSLSSKISSCQGVVFQSISCRGNLGLDEEESGTCAPDVPGPLGAWSI
jgi:hypothetical protein